MIVDDSKVMRIMIQKGLRQAGYECDIVEASDGVEALSKLDSSVNIVLIDWNMPKMNGLDLVKAIRIKGNQVPLLMISTEGSGDRVEEALKEGANGYIIKPFTPEKIKEKFETIFRK